MAKSKNNKNASAAAASSAGGDKKGKSSMSWTDSETQRLLEEFSEVKMTNKEQNTGGAAGLSTTGWNKVLEKMNQPFNSKKKDAIQYEKSQLQSKMKAAAKDYQTVRWMQNKTGIGYADGCFTHDEETKKEMIAQDKHCAKFFKKGLSHYQLLHPLFKYVLICCFILVRFVNY